MDLSVGLSVGWSVSPSFGGVLQHPPLIEIQKDEIVQSDTRPDMKLRRVEVKFYSQELEGNCPRAISITLFSS